MRTTRIGLTLLTAAAALATLAACTGAPSAASTPARTTSTPSESATSVSTTSSAPASSTPAPTTSAAASSCGSDNATTAVQKAVIAIPAPIPSIPSAHWDAPHAEVSGYDPCAALSWAVVGTEDGTPSSPNAILLFHDGAFLGTATSVQYPFEPTVSRRSADSLAVTYRYAKPSDANANPSGSTDATFTWDTTHRRVVMAGSVPPSR